MDLLDAEGIGLDEVLLCPCTQGTQVIAASSQEKIRALLEGGLSLAKIVIPRTWPGTPTCCLCPAGINQGGCLTTGHVLPAAATQSRPSA